MLLTASSWEGDGQLHLAQLTDYPGCTMKKRAQVFFFEDGVSCSKRALNLLQLRRTLNSGFFCLPGMGHPHCSLFFSRVIFSLYFMVLFPSLHQEQIQLPIAACRALDLDDDDFENDLL